MEIFGWVTICILAGLGITLLGLLIVPNLVTIFKVLLYKNKKNLEASKIDVDEKNKEKLNRNIVLRQKQKELNEVKLAAKTKKISAKIKKIMQDNFLDKPLSSEEVENVQQQEIFVVEETPQTENLNQDKEEKVELLQEE